MFDDHPSLSASLEDFEHNEPASPTFRLPSQHSGFKLEDSEQENESNSEEPWSPPAWKNPPSNSGWYRHQPYLQQNSHLRRSMSPVKSRELSPEYESAKEDEGDYTLPANIPLPRDSVSPAKELPPGPAVHTGGGVDFEESFAEREETSKPQENPGNCLQALNLVVHGQLLTWFKIFVSEYVRKFSIGQKLWKRLLLGSVQ